MPFKQHDVKIKTVALSVLINLCSHNPIPLKLLELQINLVDLQKKIPVDVYGILVRHSSPLDFYVLKN